MAPLFSPPPFFSPLPIPSTSRLPLPSHSRSFHSTRPTHRPHILHPTTRLRLTNLTFYLCAIVSITTVSLTMSGSIGNGSVVGCPARPGGGMKAGVGAAEELKGKGKGKSRWLEDPVPIARREREEEVLRPGKDGRLLERAESGKEEMRRIGGNEREEEDSAIGWRSWVGRGATSRREEKRIGESIDGRKEQSGRTGFAEGEGRIV